MQFGDFAVGSSVVFWGAIVLFVLIGNYFSYKTRESKHRMLEKLAEKGQTISPDLLASLGNGRDHDRHSNPAGSGIFLMCIGIALAVFFWALSGGGGLFQGTGAPMWLTVIGIFPFMVGLARLLGALTNRRSSK
ncbi:MAG: DUF6249 domain-containing protein [Rhizomicrobium sp.]|jgi:hypothetical protein